MDTLATDTNLLNVVTGLHATDKVNAVNLANKLQQDTEQECGIDDFNKEKHQAERKASIFL